MNAFHETPNTIFLTFLSQIRYQYTHVKNKMKSNVYPKVSLKTMIFYRNIKKKTIIHDFS